MIRAILAQLRRRRPLTPEQIRDIAERTDARLAARKAARAGNADAYRRRKAREFHVQFVNDPIRNEMVEL